MIRLCMCARCNCLLLTLVSDMCGIHPLPLSIGSDLAIKIMSVCWLRQTGLAWLRMAGINTWPRGLLPCSFSFWSMIKIIWRGMHHHLRALLLHFLLFTFLLLHHLLFFSFALFLAPSSLIWFTFSFIASSPFLTHIPSNSRIHKTHRLDSSFSFLHHFKK